MLLFFVLNTESTAQCHYIHWVRFAYRFLKELRRPQSASPLSGMCTSLLFTVFLPLQFGRSFHRSSRLSVQLPWGPPSLPPLLHLLSSWSGLVRGLSCCHCCCSWPSSATIFHQNTKPQWSIQAQARSIAAPPSHPTLFWLGLLFRLSHCQ